MGRERERSEVKERIYTAVDCMGEEEASALWNVIYKDFNEYAQWALIPEEEPDEFDLEMLREIENDPDCHIFLDGEEVEKMLLGSPVDEDRTA